MWISRKKWCALNKRITDLEELIQSRLNPNEDDVKKSFTECLRHFQSEATRDNAPKSS